MPKPKKTFEGVGAIVALTKEEHSKVHNWKDSNPLLGVMDEISNQLFGAKHAQVILGNPPAKSNCYMPIVIPAKPGQKARATMITTGNLKKYEKDFYIQCNHYRNANIDEYFELDMDVYFPTQRSDLDNSLKVVLDCLQKVHAFSNDNLCTRITVRKFLDKLKPRIEFTNWACREHTPGLPNPRNPEVPN